MIICLRLSFDSRPSVWKGFYKRPAGIVQRQSAGLLRLTLGGIWFMWAGGWLYYFADVSPQGADQPQIWLKDRVGYSSLINAVLHSAININSEVGVQSLAAVKKCCIWWTCRVGNIRSSMYIEITIMIQTIICQTWISNNLLVINEWSWWFSIYLIPEMLQVVQWDFALRLVITVQDTLCSFAQFLHCCVDFICSWKISSCI